MRTLHHYDELGLLSPSGRSEAGYRLYSYEDLARLREISAYRMVGGAWRRRLRASARLLADRRM